MSKACPPPTSRVEPQFLRWSLSSCVVGVDIHEGNHAWQSHVIEFFAIGTAVLPLEREIAPDKIPDPIMVLSVND